MGAIRPASTSAPRRARSTAAATKGARSAVSRGTCPTSTRSKRPDVAEPKRALHRPMLTRTPLDLPQPTMPAQLSPEAAAVVRVRIASPLRSYTGAAVVEVAVPVLAPEHPPALRGVLAALDLAYPGIRFRIIDEQGTIHRHNKQNNNKHLVRDLAAFIPSGTELM